VSTEPAAAQRAASDPGEPWRTAWRLIEESWDNSQEEDSQSMLLLDVHDRIKRGERSGALIETIVGLVRPSVKVEPFTRFDMSFRRLPRRPKLARDLMSIALSSGELVDPTEIGLESIADVRFLDELAYSLDAAVLKGSAIADRI